MEVKNATQLILDGVPGRPLRCDVTGFEDVRSDCLGAVGYWDVMCFGGPLDAPKCIAAGSTLAGVARVFSNAVLREGW